MRRYRLTEGRLRGIIHEAVTNVLNDLSRDEQDQEFPVEELKNLVEEMSYILDEYDTYADERTEQWYDDEYDRGVDNPQLNNEEFAVDSMDFDTDWGTVTCYPGSCYGSRRRCYFPESWQKLGFKNYDGNRVKVTSEYAERTCKMAGIDISYSRRFKDEEEY